METGTPRFDANNTRPAVVMFAVKPCPVLRSVIRLLIVSATRFDWRIPPRIMAIPTTPMPTAGETTAVISSKAAILGVSFTARLKQTAPALR